MGRQRVQQLNRDDVERAAFIDFESRTTGPITLIGVFAPDTAEPFRQYVVDPAFAPMVAHSSPSITWPVEVLDPAGVLGLLAALRGAGRRLFAWSNHDQRVVQQLADECGLDPVEVENAVPHARRWKRRVHPEVVLPKSSQGGSHTLYNYEALIGAERPAIWAGHLTGKRIGKVWCKLSKGVGPGDMTPTQKGYWTNVLIHNRLDCASVHRLLVEVAG